MTARKAPSDAATLVKQGRATKKYAKTLDALASGTMTIRDFVSDPNLINLDKLNPSPAMWAIYDAACGVPVTTITDEESQEIFGCSLAELPNRRQREIFLHGGLRGGKTSRLLAVVGLYCGMTVKLPNLGRGEWGRVLVMSKHLSNAKDVMEPIRGLVADSELLTSMLTEEVSTNDDGEIDETEIGNSERIRFRRKHDGKLIEVVAKAVSKGGTGARGKNYPAVLLDEAAFFNESGTSEISDKTVYDAAAPRVPPGGQLWMVSTANIRGVGLLEKRLRGSYGNHDNGLGVIVSTRQLNPGWDPDHSIENSMRATDPENADREIYCIPLAEGSGTVFSEEHFERAKLQEVDIDGAQAIGAGADYAHTSDKSAFAIVRRYQGGIFAPVFLKERPSGKNVKPTEVYTDFAQSAKVHAVKIISSDVHVKENAREVYERHGIGYKQAPSTTDTVLVARTLFQEGRISFALLTEEERKNLCHQLSKAVRIPLPSGGWRVKFIQETSITAEGKGTSHSDLAQAFCNALCEAGASNPALWTHDTERRASRLEQSKNETPYAPRPGSREALSMMRAPPGFQVPAGGWLSNV